MTTKTMTSAAGFAMTGVECTDLPVSATGSRGLAAVAVGSWRQVQAPISGTDVSTAGAMSTVTVVPITGNTANALPATNVVPVKPAALPLGTTRHLVTTKDAGRGNKGSSPWRFPV